MNQLDQTIEDLKFCVETLGMNDDEVEEFMNITSNSVNCKFKQFFRTHISYH